MTFSLVQRGFLALDSTPPLSAKSCGQHDALDYARNHGNNECHGEKQRCTHESYALALRAFAGAERMGMMWDQWPWLFRRQQQGQTRRAGSESLDR